MEPSAAPAHPVAPEAPTLAATIVVATYNRRGRLQTLLAALEPILGGRSDVEVVVVNDGSDDGTGQMLEAHRAGYSLRFLNRANGGPSAARNAGIAAARGELVVFWDDDVVPVDGALEAHLAAHHRDPRLVAFGPMLAPPGRTLDPWLEWEAMTVAKQYRAMLGGAWRPSPRQFYTANASVRRRHLLAAGGFDESFRRAEDVELAYRLQDLGLRFAFIPEASVYHDPVRSLDGWLRVAYDYGRQEVTMEGLGRGHLGHALNEFGDRHPLNRLLPRLLVGRPALRRALLALSRPFLGHAGRPLPRRLRLAICSGLFSVQFWQGIADATGRGRRVWEVAA